MNGAIIPLSQASVGLYDLGLLRGFGIYEGLITHNRKPFALADHLARFHRSADQMQLKISVSDAEIERVLHELIGLNVQRGKEGLIRIILTGGTAIEGIAHDQETPTFYALVEEFTPIDEKYFNDGCSIATFEHQRQFPELKTTNYIQAVLLQKLKREKGVLEVLYISHGTVLEATGSNFFIVEDGTIVTPKEGILEGITRKIVLELAHPHFPIEERAVSVDEMYAADEAFITGSFKEVVPVVKVGDRMIGGGKPGPVTQKVMALFGEHAKNYGKAGAHKQNAPKKGALAH
jgi:branched-subunit amino acid aminotransferase/4-amino-4-deoxychorismate lyase